MSEDQPIDPQNVKIPDTLPLIPVRDIVVFPYMVLPLFVGRDMSIKAIEAALEGDRMVFLATQKSHETETPGPEEIFSIGTVGMIMRMLKLPDERIKILVQGVTKGRIAEYVQTAPYYSVQVEKLPAIPVNPPSLETEAVLRTAKETLDRLTSLGKILMPDVMVVIENLDEPGRLADIIISNLAQKVDVTQEILETEDPVARLKQVTDILGKEIEVMSMQQKIQAEAKGEIGRFLEDVAITKVYVTESFKQTMLDATQIWGGRGVCFDWPIQQDMRDSLSSTIWAGTSETLRNTIAKAQGL